MVALDPVNVIVGNRVAAAEGVPGVGAQVGFNRCVLHQIAALETCAQAAGPVVLGVI